VHELGHRHLWQLVERMSYLDGHKTLYLILDRVWADVWGEDFAEAQVRSESAWLAEDDYAAAWRRARGRAPAGRAELWDLPRGARTLRRRRCGASRRGSPSTTMRPHGAGPAASRRRSG